MKTSVINEWSVIEDGFDPARHEASESLFSIGNGHMGQRANFEERYSGASLAGSYVAGVYYPDKTRVGWWKNGYPAYFAKVLNAPNWIGIDVTVNGQTLDLAMCSVEEFRRELDMKRGVLHRSFIATLPDGARIAVEASRFVSMARPEVGAVRYRVTALSDLALRLEPYLDGDVRNQDSNYNEHFWNILEAQSAPGEGYLLAQTRKLDFRVGLAMRLGFETGDAPSEPCPLRRELYVSNVWEGRLASKAGVMVTKYVAVATSLDHDKSVL